MGVSQEFEKWLMENKGGRKLKRTSAYAYARAIETISDDMRKQVILHRSLYSTTSTSDLIRVINLIKENDFFNNKNTLGHNMYSVALGHYLEFIRSGSL